MHIIHYLLNVFNNKKNRSQLYVATCDVLVIAKLKILSS